MTVTFESSEPASPPANTVVASDTIGGIDFQAIKVAWGDPGAWAYAAVGSPLPVQVTVDTTVTIGSVFPTTQWSVTTTPSSQITVSVTPSSQFSVTSSLTSSTAVIGAVMPSTQWTVSTVPSSQATVTTSPSSTISVAPSSQWTVSTTPTSQATVTTSPSSQWTVTTTPSSVVNVTTTPSSVINVTTTPSSNASVVNTSSTAVIGTVVTIPSSQANITTTPSSVANVTTTPSSVVNVTTTPSSQITASVTPSSQFTVTTTPSSNATVILTSGTVVLGAVQQSTTWSRPQDLTFASSGTAITPLYANVTTTTTLISVAAQVTGKVLSLLAASFGTAANAAGISGQWCSSLGTSVATYSGKVYFPIAGGQTVWPYNPAGWCVTTTTGALTFQMTAASTGAPGVSITITYVSL